MTNEERRRVLDMLASGKITADEADRLLEALDNKNTSEAEQESEGKPQPKYIFIKVDGTQGGASSRGEQVSIKVPIRMLRAGVKLASILPGKAGVKVQEALHNKGLDLDNLKPETLREIISSLSELNMDIESDRGKVRIYTE